MPQQLKLEASVTMPTDNIKLQATQTSCFIGEKNQGSGTLCVAESCLTWQKENDTSGLCFSYPNIALHAVSKDLAAFPAECLYLILEENDEDQPNENDDNDEEEASAVTQIRFVPSDKALLNLFFIAMNECQALYPDHDMSGDEQDQQEYEENEDDEEEQSEEGVYDDKEEDGEGMETNEAQIARVLANAQNPDEIELSAQGHAVLRRLNINYAEHRQHSNNDNFIISEHKNGNGSADDTNEEERDQYADAEN